MHALIVAATGAAGTAETAGPAAALAAAWIAAAPRCAVEPLVLPSRTLPPADPSTAPTAPPGVFVPTTALGLSRVEPPPVAPEIRLLAERVAATDLVVVHLPVIDGGALHEGPVADAARAAAPHAVPVVVLAGRSEVTRRELAAAGVVGVHEIGDPWQADVVGRAARTWAPSWGTGSTS